jgi:acyl-coenzyme A synthetase/AMP-(fatty) acid ligase
MIAESIALHARRTPQKLAMVDPHGVELNYAELHRLLANLVVELESAIPELRHCTLVGVTFYDRRWQLLLMLALESLGIAHIPFENLSQTALSSTLAYCDLVLSSHALPSHRGRQFVIGRDLISRVEGGAAKELVPYRFSAEETLVVLTTSGSTGASKCVPLTRAAVDARDNNRIWQYGLSSGCHLMVALPVGVTGVLFTWRGALRCGGALDFSQKQDPIRALTRSTHTILLPLHVRQLLSVVPDTYQAVHELKLFVLGARLSNTLRAAAVERLGAAVYSVYGSNEAGACAFISEDGTACVMAGVQAQVTAPDGSASPLGATGELRIRSSEMAERYLGEKLPGERFAEGWFKTGDLATLVGTRQWRLVGRTDTMVNLGGIKYSSEELEDRLIARQLARDLAISSVADRDGIEELYIALEAAILDDPSLIKAVADTLGTAMGNIRIVHLPQIPRGEQGKLQRSVLSQMIREQIMRLG